MFIAVDALMKREERRITKPKLRSLSVFKDIQDLAI